MKSKVPSPDKCEYVSKILKTLSHPQRLLMLCYLTEEPKSVNELADLTEASQSAVSQFLARMKAEGLVKSERDNNFMYYSVANPEVKQVIQSLYKIFNS